MKAVVYTKLGLPEVLQLSELERPLPNANEVLVKVYAASVNALDWRRFASQLESDKIPVSTRLMDGMILKAVVCSTQNLETASSLGADHVIDYTKEDFTRNERQYDLIIAINGYHTIRDYKRALSPRGVYVTIGGSTAQILQALLLGPFLSLGSRRLGFMGIAKMNQTDMVFLGKLAETGKVVPVIDRCYPLSEAAKAIRYLAEGHAKGKVVLVVSHSKALDK